MLLSLSKIKRTLDVLAGRKQRTLFKVDRLTALEVDDYKNSNTPPDGEYTPFRTVDGRDKRFWIKADFSTPDCMEGYEYSLQISTGISGWDALNPQMIFYINGEMREGLDINHRTVALAPSTEYKTYCYLYSGVSTGHFDVDYRIIATNKNAEALYYDMLVPYEACRDVYPEGSTEYAKTMTILEEACNLLDIRACGEDTFGESVEKAAEYIRTEYYDKLCSTVGKPTVSCVGHTHIDVEWQWDRRQTREKMQRSASTALSLMERYPEYLFMLSQPELYRYLKEEAPEKYAELAERVSNGQWEVDGALYLECDCNLISGESMIRQLMYGKDFFRKEFGKESRVCFLPDVFGYSAAMPQILKGAEVDYFVTSKISWNDTNTMPYDAFMWRGIDGSEIFASFITGQRTKKGEEPKRNTSYVGEITPSFIDGTWARFKQKEYANRTLNTYGHGDGGGGPTREMLEYARRLSRGIPGLPVAKLTTLRDHLDLMYKEFCDSADRLKYTPRWVGELYLEYHRGTYTTMARNKRGNRKSELALGLCEALLATEELLGYDADKSGLYPAWQTLLHNQFHDILPGSSIGSVYEFTRADYASLHEFTDNKCKLSLSNIAKNLNTAPGVLVYNPSGFDRCGTFRLGDKTYATSETIPAFGYKVVTNAISDCAVKADGLSIESGRYRILLDESGRIISLLDKKAARELVPKGALMNEWQVYEDYPLNYDAWDIEEYTTRKPYILSGKADITPISDGARAGLQITHTYLSSTISEKIWLYDYSPRIDLECVIDWKEHNQLVKLIFPTDIHSNEIEC
ncbi:MAG: alpha-mannosidase, partial [Clostridia bacterium]|nr:alpha-mannosidase [Clostridia bacterium]